ncbi:MAG: hypothetical protein OXE87_16895 [Chloroflexi bacterium]|nr:hypothetical protein [Chloroflexota bacterium]
MLAYHLSDASRQPGREVGAVASNTSEVWEVWFDGEPLWVVDDQSKRLYAYGVPGLDRERSGRIRFDGRKTPAIVDCKERRQVGSPTTDAGTESRVGVSA